MAPLEREFVTQRRKFDEEIATLEATLHSLKRRRNTYTTFNRLPNDILSHIFITYKESFFITSKESFPVDGDRRAKWTTILAICSHWREVALNTPRFWATMSLANPRLVETMVQHSKKAPIDLHIPLHKRTRSFWDALDAVLAENYRLENISVTICASCKLSFLHGFMDRLDNMEHSAILLSSLSLTNIGVRPISLERSLPWCKFPHLRSFELNGVLFPPDTPLLPSLTNLTISCEFSEGPRLSLPWILTFLRRTPNLENITFGDVASSSLPEANDLGSTPRALVSLPRLRTVSANVEDLCDVKLFDWLELPSPIELHINFVWFLASSGAMRPEILTSLHALLSRLTALHKQKAIQKMELFVDRHTSRFALELFCEGDQDAGSHGMSFPVVEKHLNVDDYFNLCLSTLPLAEIGEFTVEDNFKDPQIAPAWLTMLSAFENLAILNFKSVHPTTLLTILIELVDPSQQSIQLRALETISFYGVDWPVSSGLRTDVGVDMQTLEKFLRRRREVEVPLRKLIFLKCSISPQQIDALRGYVDVDWDGITELSDDYMIPDYVTSRHHAM